MPARSHPVESVAAIEDPPLDVTKNIFYWFRGPSGHGSHSQRQLENNLTKSLVNVLEYCDRRVVLRAFLTRLGLRAPKEVAFSLQRRPALASMATRRIVLGITGGEADITDSPTATELGRPDAWICANGWTVLVESKIGPKIKEAQLRAHAKAAGWAKGTYRVECLSWDDIYRSLKRAKQKLAANDRLSRLLLGQWLSYMESQNMTEFEKLEPLDFDFVNLGEDERRYLLPTMKKRIRGLANLLAKTPAARRIAKLYGRPDADHWKFGEPMANGRGSWFNIGGNSSMETWHVTVFYYANGLRLSIVCSRQAKTKKLCRGDDSVFHDVVEAAAACEVSLLCRRAWYANPKSSYKGQKISHADDPLIVSPAAMSKGLRPAFAESLKKALADMSGGKRWRTELQVFRDIPRAELLELGTKAQAKLLANALEDMRGILIRLMETQKPSKTKGKRS